MFEKNKLNNFTKVFRWNEKYFTGIKAVKELKIRDPLQEAILMKNDICLFSKEMDLPTWNKATNSCLATRIPWRTSNRPK